jgi:hypothetical protein
MKCRKKRIAPLLPLFILVILTAGCAQAATAASHAPAQVAETTATRAGAGTPASFLPGPAETNQQAYVDPNGWFSVDIPVGWKSKSMNVFSGKDGFFETGYMPEMTFMQSSVNVCQWLANIESKSVYSVQAPTKLSEKAGNCTLTTLPGISPAVVQAIVENPDADYEHRFLYIKTNVEYFDQLINTFVWLRPVDQHREPAYQVIPLRPADASFWENTVSMPSELSVTEYALPEEAQDESPSKTIFSEFIPADAPRMEKAGNSADTSSEEAATDHQLIDYGYKLITDATGKIPDQLYKDGTLLFENVDKVSQVYTFSTSSKPIVAFVVRTDKEEWNSYLVQNDVITEWGLGWNDPPLAPILNKGQLLWVRATEDFHVQVQTSSREVVFTFATYFGADLPVKGFHSWDDHWVLEVSNFIIQDGEILNEKFGFEEAFDWQLINGRPLYFFRQGSRAGISYDGQFLSTYYDDVVHGFCCGLTLNNPVGDESNVYFFAKRDDIWYYVTVKVD